MPLQELGEHAHAAIPHDLYFGVGLHELLPNNRVFCQPSLRREHHQTVNFCLEADRHCRRSLSSFKPKQRHCNGPSVVHTADNIVFRTESIGVKDLVEL